MRQILLASACAALAVIVSPSVASAQAVTYMLQGVTFSDGGAANGSFTFNAATDTISNWNLTTTAGSILGGQTYNTADSWGGSGPFGPNSFDFILNTGAYYTTLTFAGTLPASGADLITTGNLSYECNNCGNYRVVTAGEVVAETVDSVPEPASLALFSAGLVGVFVARQKNKSLRRLGPEAPDPHY